MGQQKTRRKGTKGSSSPRDANHANLNENICPNSGETSVDSLVSKAAKLAAALEKTEAELHRVRTELTQSQKAVATVAQVSALEAHAKEVEGKMKALCQRDDEHKSQRDAARREALEIKASLESLQKEYDASKAAFDKEKKALEEEKMQLRATVAHREKKLLAIQADANATKAQAVVEAEDRVAKAEAQEDALRVELQAAKDATRIAQASEQAALAEADKAKRQLEERRAAVKAGDIRAAQLETRVAMLQKQLKMAQQAVKGQDAVALDLENQLSATENELRNMKTAFEDASARLPTLEARIVELEAGAEDAAAVLEAKEWRIEDLVTQVKDLREAVKEAESDAGAAKAAVESTRGRLADLAAQRTEDIEIGLKTLRALEEEVSSLKAAAGRKEMKYKAAQEELNVLRGGNAHGDSMAALAAEVAMLREKTVRLENDLAKSQTAGAADKAALEEMERRLVDAEGRVAAAHASRAAALAEMGRLRAAIEAQDAELASLKVQMAAATKEENDFLVVSEKNALLESRVKELEESLAENASDLEAKEWRIDDLLHQTNELRETAKEAINEVHVAVQERVAAEEAHEAALVEQREALTAQGEAAVEKAKASLRKEMEAFEYTAKDMKSRIEAVEAKSAKLREELQAAKAADKKKDQEVQQLTEERNALMGAIEELQNALKLNETQHMEALDCLQSTQAELSSCQEELKTAQGKISATEALIERLAATKMASQSTDKIPVDVRKGGKSALRQNGGKENGKMVSAANGKGPLEIAAGAQRSAPLRPLSANALH